MLEGRRALDLALDLARMPTLAAGMRQQPLPPDTLVLIRIAAGCAETAQEAATVTGTKIEKVREAAIFYLQQVLFAPSSDSYRILGVRPGAPRSEMRSHLRWLMKWLHPDRNPNDWESVFAERVIGAWRDAGSRVDAPEAEERSGTLPEPDHSRRRRGARKARQRWIALPISPSRKDQQRKRKQIAAVLIVATVGLALALFPYRVPLGGWFGIPKLAAENSVHAD